MAKEKKYNPVQAQHKADKARAIKKGKADLQARRNEKLATRNPERIQKQINDLKAIKEGGGKLTAHEEQALEALEKDLKAVKKAREALGDRAPQFKSYGLRPGGHDGSGVLGKRRRDDDEAESSGSDVPEDVRRIPMPRDTPPPIPKEVLDEWYAKRRERRAAQATNANQEPLAEGKEREAGRGQWQRSEPAAPVEAKTVYEAKPVVRDLKKEAVSAFMPTVVRMKIDKVKGQGALLEPEEADQLEKEGYFRNQSPVGAAASGIGEMDVDHKYPAPSRRAMVEDADDED
ncbi:WW domain binding protein 11-domain-containing protein [Podospora aff. communis PSN243]|uniref:WW domain binding protein 11-domain-containing protein n=1 Tax=Podospora aff. communis PSN243 TaxID=3040156 RepID=A0AAV9H3S2_9PEZI|nr:WW domain binding protein 11-domain-containing protein [Podospora aff. communis PSN243]